MVGGIFWIPHGGEDSFKVRERPVALMNVILLIPVVDEFGDGNVPWWSYTLFIQWEDEEKGLVVAVESQFEVVDSQSTRSGC